MRDELLSLDLPEPAVRAVVQTGFGGPEVLVATEVGDPVAGPADVVLRVRACALNRLDVIQQRGPAVIPGFRLPHIAGMDVAGVVVEVGREVTRLAVGDEVVVDPAVGCGVCPRCRLGTPGYCRDLRIVGGNVDGGLAEYVAVPAHALHLLPAGLELADAALLPSAWATAWHALHGIGRVTVDDQVLVHAAASGVSIAAVQLAQQAGARVIATASTPAKRALAAELGADLVLDSGTDVTAAVLEATGGSGIDVVLDHVGSATWAQSLAVLGIGGRLVTLGNTSGDAVELSLSSLYHRGIAVLGAGAYTPTEFETVLSVYARSGLRVVRAGVYPLAETGLAMRRQDSRELIGKLVIEP
jgi:NADPH:quinone reductase-like Zn-dependent oxidoreductase